MHVKYRQDNFASYDMVHRYVWDNGHGLTIHVKFMVKCVCQMGHRSNGCFMACATLMGSHYRMDITRSDSFVSLVLCIIAYNIQGTSVVLKVHRDSANLTGNR
jgi:hypothetical protein